MSFKRILCFFMTLEWPFDALGNRDLGYLIARGREGLL